MSTGCERSLWRLAWLLALAGCGGALDGDVAVAASLSPASGGVAIGPTPGSSGPQVTVRNPYEQDTAAARAGRQNYVRFNCYGCHGGHGGGGMGPSLRDPDWLYGRSAEHIYDSIARGRARGMPAWQARLPEVEIWRLVSYVQTLGTSSEVDPPR